MNEKQTEEPPFLRPDSLKPDGSRPDGSPEAKGVDPEAMQVAQLVHQAVKGSLKAFEELIAKYHVSHIVIGPIERREFPDLDEAAIARLAGSAPVTSGPYALYPVRR